VGVSINENIIDEIKSRCNIVDIIGRAMTLKKSGSNYKGVCPFHNEKTPSFVVSESKQIYTCFGCGATGDVIEFVQRYYTLDFMGAIEKLACEHGITIESNFKKSQKKDEFYNINREAASFFYQAFTEKANPGYTYMKNRGLDSLTLKRFGIGYADGEWNSLYQHFMDKGVDPKVLLELGLISESNGRYFDKFRNRVIFPIINTNGKVIGFGGRALGDGTPKYLNSPETPVFLKKNNLYGLNLTRQDISKDNCAILVEGYMDVISLYKVGIRNVSASLGTALTENQASLLKRYTNNIVLSYDADDAGMNAALRGMDILYKEGCRVKVLHISDGKDPDDFIKKNGKQAFLDLVGQALPYADYKLSVARGKNDLNSTEARVEFLQAAVAILRTLSPIEADIYIKKVAEEMKITESAIRLEINGNNIQSTSTESHRWSQSKTLKKRESDDISMLEKNLIKLILTDSSYYDKLKPYEFAFRSDSGDTIYSGLKEIYVEDEQIDIKKLADGLDGEKNKVLSDILENVQFAGKEEQVFLDCIRTMEQRKLKLKQEELNIALSMSSEDENQENIEKIMKEIQKIQQQIRGQGGI